MAQFIIHGGKPISGTIIVSGAKNAALKFIAASLLCDEPVTLTRVPAIDDVRRMLDILIALGATITYDQVSHTVTIDPRTLQSTAITPEQARTIRTSIMLVGPLLARHATAAIGYPGGCVIGRRPIDLYLDGYTRFGAEIKEENDFFTFTAKQLAGTTLVFPFVSVVATETFMMMATRVSGITVLKNAAMEPEVVALADFLNSCGAQIMGAGTPTITITGVSSLTGGTVAMIPDRIEAGTFVLLGTLMRSTLRVDQCAPEHLDALLELLRRVGAPFTTGLDWIETQPYTHTLRAVNIKTHEYPGFVTDLQAPFTVLLTQAAGLSLVHETIFEGRLFYTDLLNRMGANIILCDPHRALVEGPTQLRGKKLESPDIRAGIAMIMAGLVANGETTIQTIEQVDRGYEQIDTRLRALGADIMRVA